MISVIRTKQCPCCGSTVYSKELDYYNEYAPVWVCNNCGDTTKRITRKRLTVRSMAFAKWEALLADYKQVKEQVIASGKWYSLWHHMDALTDHKVKITRWDMNYHADKAREILDSITKEA